MLERLEVRKGFSLRLQIPISVWRRSPIKRGDLDLSSSAPDPVSNSKSHADSMLAVRLKRDNVAYQHQQLSLRPPLPAGDVTPSDFPAAVRRILRVQNPDEYDYYAFARAKVGGERWLFHGTSADAAERIAAVGFDRSFARRCAFGPGCYFARTPSVSVQYCEPDADGVQRMFLAQVLVGTWTSTPRGGSPPVVKTGGTGGYARFDSVVDSEFNPDIFVVFQDHQAYPAYLIEFTVPSAEAPAQIPQPAGAANRSGNSGTNQGAGQSNLSTNLGANQSCGGSKQNNTAARDHSSGDYPGGGFERGGYGGRKRCSGKVFERVSGSGGKQRG